MGTESAFAYVIWRYTSDRTIIIIHVDMSLLTVSDDILNNDKYFAHAEKFLSTFIS